MQRLLAAGGQGQILAQLAAWPGSPGRDAGPLVGRAGSWVARCGEGVPELVSACWQAGPWHKGVSGLCSLVGV